MIARVGTAARMTYFISGLWADGLTTPMPSAAECDVAEQEGVVPAQGRSSAVRDHMTGPGEARRLPAGTGIMMNDTQSSGLVPGRVR